jgi:glutamate 5-kinase
MSTVSNIQIDEGAKLALEKNASLLSKGVVKIDKSFNIGDGLTVAFNKKIIAKGIAKTDSDSLNSDNLLIHKDDLIIL